MARLDRLGPAKAIAQIGAAIGREFRHALFVLVARLPEHELAAALDRLVQSGLLSRQGTPPHDQAIEYYLSAAQRATAAFNTIEASAHLRSGMVLLEQLPPSEPRRVQLLQGLAMGGWWH
jgi:predicted ATPase